MYSLAPPAPRFRSAMLGRGCHWLTGRRCTQRSARIAKSTRTAAGGRRLDGEPADADCAIVWHFGLRHYTGTCANLKLPSPPNTRSFVFCRLRFRLLAASEAVLSPLTPRPQVHFFAVKVTQSLSRLATQMERVAVFDFSMDDLAGHKAEPDGSVANQSDSALEEGLSRGRPGSSSSGDRGGRWVQATSLLTEVAAMGRSFSLMSLNLRSFERYVTVSVLQGHKSSSCQKAENVTWRAYTDHSACTKARQRDERATVGFYVFWRDQSRVEPGRSNW